MTAGWRLAALGQVAAWPATGAAGVVGADGRQDVSGPRRRIFAWASVTKLLTAMAALVAVEEGAIDLDDPAGPPGATIRHLLAHASGLPPEGGAPIAAPGQRRIYSNAGIEVLGAALATATGIPVLDYIREAVVEPLAMAGTTLTASPAWGASGPLEDLLRLGSELLTPTLVAPDTLDAATRVAFPHLDGVLPGFGQQRPNDWGLGFEIRAHKSPHWTGDPTPQARSVTSASRVRSSGSIPRCGWPAPASPIGTSVPGPPPRGRRYPTRCWPRCDGPRRRAERGAWESDPRDRTSRSSFSPGPLPSPPVQGDE